MLGSLLENYGDQGNGTTRDDEMYRSHPGLPLGEWGAHKFCICGGIFSTFLVLAFKSGFGNKVEIP